MPVTTTPGACQPSGTEIRVSAKDIAFDTDCLAAPAGEPFTIAFDNRESGIPHNVAIYPDTSASRSLFAGEIITGPKMVTYQVPALEAGTYFFRCDVHPNQMTGTFVVG